MWLESEGVGAGESATDAEEFGRPSGVGCGAFASALQSSDETTAESVFDQCGTEDRLVQAPQLQEGELIAE